MDQAPYLIPRGRWGYRMGDAQIYDSRAARRPERRVFRAAFGLAHEDLVREFQITARSRIAGRCARSSVSRRAGGRQVPGRDRPGRGARAEKARPIREGRAQPARHDARDAGEARAGIPRGRHNHRRQCARTEQRRVGHGRWPTSAGPKSAALRRRRALSPMALRRSSRACSASGPFRRSSRRSRAPDGRSGRRAHRNQRGVRRDRARRSRANWAARRIVNVEGGAIAHGHPIGATGAVLTTA